MTFTAHGIEALRRDMGMTQEQFAERLRVTAATVRRWEAGHAEPTRVSQAQLALLASSLHLLPVRAISRSDAQMLRMGLTRLGVEAGPATYTRIEALARRLGI